MYVFTLCEVQFVMFYYNHGQKSWDKFSFVALFQTRQTNSHARIHLHLVSPSPPPSPPPTMLDTCTRYFSRVSSLYCNSAFLKLRFEKHRKLMQLLKCPKEFCSPLSDFHGSWKTAQLRCFLALNAFRTRECEHLSLERHFLGLLPGFI